MLAFILSLTLPPQLVLGAVLGLFVWFVLRYWLPAIGISRRLKHTSAEITALPRDSVGNGKMEAVFMRSRRLQHAWSEYAETLHAQYDTVEGERRLVKLRATVPAEVFFSPGTLVDTPLRTEFFKHLPGILTGIGIIGTFAGLLAGLQNFQVGTDSVQLQASLAELMHGVREAFIASAAAIGVAMFVTFIEKFLLNRCYERAETLAQAIDHRYEAGAGEEYLSRLVDSAAESATQTRQLKDALVNDLKELLGSFSHTISESIASGLRAHGDRLTHPDTGLSGAISGAIAEGLREPMAQITRVAETVGGHQGKAVEDLMSALIGKIESTFGGQMSGLNELMAGNAAAMQDMQRRFGELVERLASAGTDTTTAVETHLRALMDEVDRRQRETNAAMIELLGQIRASVTENQRESAAKLADSVAAIGTSVDALLRDLATQREAMGAAGRQSLDELKTGLAALIEQLRDSSRETGERYGQELQRLFAEAGQRQQQLSEQVLTLVQGMQTDQDKRQARTGEALQENLAAVQNGLDQALAAIRQQLAEAEAQARSTDQERAAAEQERRRQIEQQSAELLRSLAARTEQIGSAVDQGVSALRATVDRLAQITVTGSESLERGAGAVRSAAEDMGTAGQHIAQVLDRGAELHGHVAGAAAELTTATSGLREIVANHSRQREQIDALVGTLRQFIADADDRAGISRTLVADMQQMVEQVRTLQSDTATFVQSVGEVLTDSFDTFGDAVTTNLNRTLGEITSALGNAVNMISSQIQDLDAALDQLVRTTAGRR